MSNPKIFDSIILDNSVNIPSVLFDLYNPKPVYSIRYTGTIIIRAAKYTFEGRTPINSLSLKKIIKYQDKKYDIEISTISKGKKILFNCSF